MADPVQTAQASALEIPVTVQGSKTVEGAERRELFIETTKTMLVSENGAVLKLDATVLPGQCVFLRNDKSGREILCKVLGSRQAGYTDLEFTVYDPKFWEVPAEQPLMTAPKPPAEEEMEAVMSNSAPAPSMECSPARNDAISGTLPETAASVPDAPLTETPKALPKGTNDADGTDAKDAVPDWDEARDAQLVALLASMDGKSKVRREVVAKVTGDPGSAGASADAPNRGKTDAKDASEATSPSVLASGFGRIRKFTAKQNPIYLGIAASVLIAALLGVVWHARRSSSNRLSNRLSAFSGPSGQPAPSAPLQPPQTPASAAGTNAAARAAAQPMQKIQPAGETHESIAVGQRPAPAAASSEPEFVEPSVSSEQSASGHAIHRTSKEMKAGENIPAKIVSQTQPVIPAWAEGLDMEPVVKLDALIDEKGNLVETKPISGPRMLQASAQRAVGLWVFEPGLSDGKPAATHITLTVEFQKAEGETN